MVRSMRCLCMLMLTLLLAGCGSEIETAPVEGVVTLDGKPVKDAAVKFSPAIIEDSEQVAIASGRTDENGHYSLTVVTTGQVGAAIGKNIVTISLIPEEKTGEDADVIDPMAEDPIPDQDFTFEVKEGENKADFQLSRS